MEELYIQQVDLEAFTSGPVRVELIANNRLVRSVRGNYNELAVMRMGLAQVKDEISRSLINVNYEIAAYVMSGSK